MFWEKIALFQGKNGPQFSPFIEFIMHIVKPLYSNYSINSEFSSAQFPQHLNIERN